MRSVTTSGDPVIDWVLATIVWAMNVQERAKRRAFLDALEKRGDGRSCQ